MSPAGTPAAALSAVAATSAAVSGDSFPESVAADVEAAVAEGVGVARAGRFDVEETGRGLVAGQRR